MDTVDTRRVKGQKRRRERTAEEKQKQRKECQHITAVQYAHVEYRKAK